MTEPVGFYTSTYGNFGADVLAAVRAESYGRDIGQNSWLTAEEQERFARELALAPGTRLLEVACGSGGPALFLAETFGVQVAGIEIAKDVVIRVKSTDERRSAALDTMVTLIELEWEAAQSPRLFPLMRGELSVYALSATETQLDFLGHYEPPLGALGSAIDAIVGHRIAEASVHRFLTDVAEFLRTTLK